MITIIDYDMGNLGSLLNMIKHVGGKAKISSSPEEISESKKIILPGVGRMDMGIKKLKDTKIDKAIHHASNSKQTKILGVCLGMHLLFEYGEEGKTNGLGLLKGRVSKFSFKENEKLKIPHMGWNKVNFSRDSNFFSSLQNEGYFYFVHSYHVLCQDKSNIAATCNYGYNFTCAVESDGILGAQFHPEKSHTNGKNFYKKFINL
mgnify:FL=1